MAQTIAVLSQKGGTGKTTTVRTLTDVLRRVEVKTLAVDLDPQGNLSDYFDVPPDVEPTVADVLGGASAAKAAIHGDVIPASLNLAETELMLGGKIGREMTLRRALADVKDEYEIVLVDCPPSLGLLTVNALVAADYSLVPAVGQARLSQPASWGVGSPRSMRVRSVEATISNSGMQEPRLSEAGVSRRATRPEARAAVQAARWAAV